MSTAPLPMPERAAAAPSRSFSARLHPAWRHGLVVVLCGGLAFEIIRRLTPAVAVDAPSSPGVRSLNALFSLDVVAQTPLFVQLFTAAALLGAAALMYYFNRVDQLPLTAEHATWLTVFAPTTALAIAAPALAVALLVATGALFAARRGRFGVAGVLGGMLAVLVPAGALIALPLLAEYGAARSWSPRDMGRGLLGPLTPLAAVGVWAGLANLKAETAPVDTILLALTGTTEPALPWTTVPAWIEAGDPMHAIAVVLIAAPIVACLASVKTMRPGLILLALALPIAALASSDPATAIVVAAWSGAIPASAVGGLVANRPHLERPVLAAAVTAFVAGHLVLATGTVAL